MEVMFLSKQLSQVVEIIVLLYKLKEHIYILLNITFWNIYLERVKLKEHIYILLNFIFWNIGEGVVCVHVYVCLWWLAGNLRFQSSLSTLMRWHLSWSLLLTQGWLVSELLEILLSPSISN